MIKTIRRALLAVFFITPFFNGSKGPAAAFIFETVIFILFFIFLKFSDLRKSGIENPTALFFISVVFSTLNTMYFDSSINTVILLISYCIFFYMVISVYDEQFKKYFYTGFVAVSAALAVIIVIQVFMKTAPKATMPNANMAAGYIAAGASLVLAILVLEKPKFKLMPAYSLLFLFFWIAVALTHSRGGIFALAGGIAAVMFFKFKKRGVLIFTALFLVVFISLPKKTLMNIAKTDGDDVYSLKRPAIWKSAVDIIKEKPLAGAGPGNFELAFYKHNFPVEDLIARYSRNTRFAHNEFLQIAAEGGLFTLFFFLFIVTVIFKNGAKFSPVSTVVLTSITAQSLVDFNLHLPALVFAAIILSAGILRKNHAEELNLDKRYIRVFLAALLIFNVFNFFIKPFNAEKYKITADKFIKSEPETELEFYQKAVKFSPNNFEYRRITGELFYTAGDILNAMKNLKESTELNPKNPFAALALANVYYDFNEPNKAAYYILKTLDIEPNCLAARYLLAKTNEKQNKIEAAVKEYTGIISAYKFFSGASFSSGYEKTLLSIDISAVYNSLGFLQMNTGKLNDAMSNYDLSIKSNPENVEAYSNLASVYYMKKKYSEALRYGKLAAFYADAREKPDHLNNLILIYQKTGNSSEIAKLKEKISILKKQTNDETR